MIEWKSNEKEKLRTCGGIGDPDDSQIIKRCRTSTSLLDPVKLVLFTWAFSALNHIFLDNLGHISRVNTSLVQSQITVQGLLRLCAWAKNHQAAKWLTVATYKQLDSGGQNLHRNKDVCIVDILFYSAWLGFDGVFLEIIK